MNLNEFLVKAKLATYANGENAEKKVLEDGAQELSFKEEEYYYRDRYYGFNPFFGQEIVWKNDKIVWFMNYSGNITLNMVSEKEIYSFLQSALRQVKEDRPCRGPNYFKEGDFEYIDDCKGNIKNFIGIEVILYKEKEVYKLNYNGKAIID